MLINNIELKELRKHCYNTLLTMYKKANAGHIGASLSCMEILIYLFFYKLKENDKFILSKGHAAAALYTILYEKGKISKKDIDSFYQDGTNFAAHPPCNRKIDMIPFGTGSLGHGLSLSAGFALASKLKNDDRKIYCVLSEGDCDEGSTWEAALFSAHHKLNNLIAIIDHNKLQGFGSTKNVMDLNPIKDKWVSFNFDVEEAYDGNNIESLHESLEKLEMKSTDKPKCIIAHTKKGYGISFMENKMEWHYLPMNDEQYQIALKEVAEAYA